MKLNLVYKLARTEEQKRNYDLKNKNLTDKHKLFLPIESIKEENIKLPDRSSHKRPHGIAPGLYCESCLSAVGLSIKNLYGKKAEYEVLDVVSDLCLQNIQE